VIDAFIDHSGFLVTWGATLLKLTTLLWGKKRTSQGTRMWLFALFVSLFVTFELDEVYTAIDRLAGVNNLSWLLAYLSITTGAYFFCTACCTQATRWLTLYLVVTLIALVAIFPFGPGSTEECLTHIVPHNLAEIVFVGLYYGFGAAMISLVMLPSLRAVYRRGRDEGERFVCLRAAAGTLASVAAVCFYALKFFAFSTSFSAPSTYLPFAVGVTNVANAMVLSFIILWLVFFASDQFYINLERLVRFAQKIQRFRKLRKLRATVIGVCSLPLPSPPEATWKDQIRNLDLHIYQELVWIMDVRRSLQRQGQERELPDDVRKDLENIGWLNQLLQSVPDTLGFEDLVNAYCHLESKVRKPRPERRAFRENEESWHLADLPLP